MQKINVIPRCDVTGAPIEKTVKLVLDKLYKENRSEYDSIGDKIFRQ